MNEGESDAMWKIYLKAMKVLPYNVFGSDAKGTTSVARANSGNFSTSPTAGSMHTRIKFDGGYVRGALHVYPGMTLTEFQKVANAAVPICIKNKGEGLDFINYRLCEPRKVGHSSYMVEDTTYHFSNGQLQELEF